MENKSKYSLKTHYTDKRRKFLFIKLRFFCKKRCIALKYTILYIYKENSLLENMWQIIVLMKKSLLFVSQLPLDFWVKAINITNYLKNKLLTQNQRRKLIPEKMWSK